MAKNLDLCENHFEAHASSSSGSPRGDWIPVVHDDYQIMNKHSTGFSSFLLLSGTNSQVNHQHSSSFLRCFFQGNPNWDTESQSWVESMITTNLQETLGNK